MATVIIMPKQGLQMTEGYIGQWFVAEGDIVTEGQPLFEMETDKLTITIDAQVGGTMLHILHPAGETVEVAQPIAVVGAPGECWEELPSALEPTRTLSTPLARTRAAEKGVDLGQLLPTGPQGQVVERDVLQAVTCSPAATPLARKVAALEGIELQTLQGSGLRGKIVAEDVHITTQGATMSSLESTDRLIPLTSMRRVIATRMKESQHVMAQTNHSLEVEMTQAIALRATYREAGQTVSYNDILLRCVAQALVEYPALNASMTDGGILQHGGIHLGVAVATEGGLLVPVLRDAHRMTLTQLAAAATRIAGQARKGQLPAEAYTGGTFTVSNLGMVGLDRFVPIINPPEAAILGVGAIEKRAVVVMDAIVVRHMATLTLAYDHRVVDGWPAAQFLCRLRQLVQNPVLLL